MSHLHAPDGVLPLWLWSSGWLITLVAVVIASKVASRHDVRRRLPLLSVVAAFMLVAMSAEIVPLAYHVNLTVIGGVLLGPALSIVATFIVELMLALLGHGGVTVIGVNSVIMSVEMLAGAWLFRLLIRALGRRRIRGAALGATVLGLALSTTLLVGVVALSDRVGGTAPDTHAIEETQGGHGTGDAHDEHGHAEPLDLEPGRFAALVYTLGPLGWLMEGLLTAWVLAYVDRIRPGLLWGSTSRGSFVTRPPGDENRGV